jgi:hypothetical protein
MAIDLEYSCTKGTDIIIKPEKIRILTGNTNEDKTQIWIEIWLTQYLPTGWKQQYTNELYPIAFGSVLSKFDLATDKVIVDEVGLAAILSNYDIIPIFA